MTWFEISPRDVWLFRDGKPFSAGEDHSAHSMFPPTPLTVQGALRQKISMSLGVSLPEYKRASTTAAQQAAEYIGAFKDQRTALTIGLFRMVGPLVSLRISERVVEPLLPAPADLLQYKQPEMPSDCFSEEIVGDLILSGPDRRLTSNLPGNYAVPYVAQDYENMPNCWLPGTAFAEYLTGRVEAITVWQKDHVYLSENRFGVAIDAATSYREEGQLYQVEFVRPQPGIGLLVQVTGIPDVDGLLDGEITIGGEQRQATVHSVSVVGISEKPLTLPERFKIVFLTPAYLSEGWLPANGDWSALFNGPVELVSAALYRPQRIGGWNGAANRPRTMHNFVAPGSVYYFETRTSVVPPPVLTEDFDEVGAGVAGQIGFGQYAVGEWS